MWYKIYKVSFNTTICQLNVTSRLQMFGCCGIYVNMAFSTLNIYF